MADTILVMYALGSGGTENAAANIDIPDDGVIRGVQVAHSADLDADGEASTVELSFIATNQISTNDSRGTLVVSRLRFAVVTSGGSTGHTNFFVPMNVNVSGGERIYLNLSATAGVATDISMLIHLDPRRQIPRRARRRT